MRNRYTVVQFLAAIAGSGGIMSTIANRIGCDWHTADKYIEKHPTLKTAYTAEREKLLDTSEGVVSGNIAFAMRELQRRQAIAQVDEKIPWEQVDSDDAKWVLARLGKHRGYAEKQEVELSGGIGLQITEVIVKRESETGNDPTPSNPGSVRG